MKRRSRRRRSRRNYWKGQPRLHRRAARKGWRGSRSRRRTRRNAGSIVSKTFSATKSGFRLNVLRRGTTILAGNVGTTFFTEKLGGMVPALTSHPVGQIAALTAVALAQSALVGKVGFLRRMLSPSDILIGGMLAAVTRTAKTLLPGTFSTCGLGEDLDGLGSWYANPYNIGSAFRLMNGMDAYASPVGVRAGEALGIHGLNDYAQLYQTQPPTVITALDGLAANQALGEEIASQM